MRNVKKRFRRVRNSLILCEIPMRNAPFMRNPMRNQSLGAKSTKNMRNSPKQVRNSKVQVRNSKFRYEILPKVQKSQEHTPKTSFAHEISTKSRSDTN